MLANTLLYGALAFATATQALPLNVTDVTKRALVGTGYGTFYNSGDCTGQASVAFAFANDACIPNMKGFNSIFIQSGILTGKPTLSFSPGGGCECQNECKPIDFQTDNYCLPLAGNVNAESFRFSTVACGANTC